MAARTFLQKLGKRIPLLIFILLVFITGLTFLTYRYFIEDESIHKDRPISKYTFGIDISHYVGHVSWDKVKTSHHPIEFVVVRATMGSNSLDRQYRKNWHGAKRSGYIRGAYHYYRPDENSVKQFNNFSSKVKLEPGDLPPILDIEDVGRLGVDNIRKGVANWLKLAEDHYGIKPIVYTGRTFYKSNMKGYIDGYPLWIASYSKKYKLVGIKWTFHQFSDKVKVKGITGLVDGNDFSGDLGSLRTICIGN